MYFASNQASDIAGPPLGEIDQRKHDEDNATKRV